MIEWVAEQESATRLDTDSASVPPLVAADLQRLLRGIRLLQDVAECDRDGTTMPVPGSASGGAPELPSRYQLQRRLGRGGFGAVYLARDRLLDRDVAVKVPRPDLVLTQDMLRRFLHEARNAATLHHPNIVPIFATETTLALPALVYHYCHGPTLSRWLKRRRSPVPPRLAAEILLRLAEAAQHAHSRGILHRDLKPGNVLLEEGDEQAAGHGFRDGSQIFVPRITDFGISKAIDADRTGTCTGVILGTLEYMSPEQASGRTSEIGTHSDLFALGVILYEMLAGRPPFQGASRAETQLQVQACKPPNLRQFCRHVPRDLEAITFKCLQRESADRYASAAALADDLRCFLEGRSVSAKHQAWLPRAVRWCVRNPILASLFVGIVILTSGLVGSLAWNYYASVALGRQIQQKNLQLLNAVAKLDESLTTTEQQRRLAEANEVRALQMVYISDLQVAADAWRRGDVRAAARKLAGDSSRIGDRIQREFAWYFLHNQLFAPATRVAHVDQTIWNLAYSPNRQWLAVTGNRGTLHLLDPTADLTMTRHWDTGQGEVNCLAFSPDSQTIATAGDDGRVGLWEVASGKPIRWLEGFPEKPIFGVVFLKEGREVVACGKSSDLFRWDAASGQLLERLTTLHSGDIEALSLSPEGTLLATAGADGQTLVYQIGQTTPQQTLGGHRGAVAALQFDSTGKLLFTGGVDGTIRTHDLATAESKVLAERPEGICALTYHDHPSTELAFSDRGGVITVVEPIAASSQGTSTPDRKTGWRVRKMWAGHEQRIAGLAFTPDGTSIISGDSVGQVQRWTGIQDTSHRVLPAAQPAADPLPQGICLGADSDSLFRIEAGGLTSWSIRQGTPTATLLTASGLRACAFTPEQQCVIVVNDQGQLGRIPIDTTRPPEWVDLFPGVALTHVQAYHQGRRLVVRNRLDETMVIDAVSRQVLKRIPKSVSLDTSPDGRWLAISQHGTNDVLILNAQTLNVVAELSAHQSTIYHVKFTPDSQRLMTGSDDRTAKIWNVTTWESQYELLGHAGKLTAIAISSDNQTLATADDQGHIKLWYAENGRELFELPRIERGVLSMQFSKDGENLLAVQVGWDLHLFEAIRIK